MQQSWYWFCVTILSLTAIESFYLSYNVNANYNECVNAWINLTCIVDKCTKYNDIYIIKYTAKDINITDTSIADSKDSINYCFSLEIPCYARTDRLILKIGERECPNVFWIFWGFSCIGVIITGAIIVFHILFRKYNYNLPIFVLRYSVDSNAV